MPYADSRRVLSPPAQTRAAWYTIHRPRFGRNLVARFVGGTHWGLKLVAFRSANAQRQDPIATGASLGPHGLDGAKPATYVDTFAFPALRVWPDALERCRAEAARGSDWSTRLFRFGLIPGSFRTD